MLFPEKGKPMRYKIGVDIGTTSTKVVLYDENLEAIAISNIKYATYHEEPGYAEQDPEEILLAFKKAMKEVLVKIGHDSQNVSLISFSSAMHSLILMDRFHKPITRSVIWSDNRCVKEVETFKAENNWKKLYENTGTPIHSMSPFFKLKWFEKHTDLLERTYKAIGIKEFIFHHLTGEYVVDYSVASATGLFNIHDLTWDMEALSYLNIEDDMLSEPVDVTCCLSPTNIEFLTDLNLPADVKLMVGASDGCLANLGSQAMVKGETTLTIGTSGAVRMTVNKPILDKEGRTFCYYLSKDKWVIGGAINNGGNILSWLDGILYENEGMLYERLPMSINHIPIGSDELLFVPYLYGERAPHWDGSLRASYIGVTAYHEKAHFVRAALEGILFNLREVWTLLEELGGKSTMIKASGGFLQSQEWSGMLADIFGMNYEVSTSLESSCLGAVLLSEKNFLPENSSRIRKNICYSEERHDEYEKYYEHYLWFSKKLIKLHEESQIIFK